MTLEKQFATLQARWCAQADAASSFACVLTVRYQKTWYAPRPKRARLERMRAAEAKTCERFYTLLDRISPRNWRSGVSCAWVRRSLTYQDATTSGPLSVTPDPSWGYLPSDSVRFAQPVPSWRT